MKSINLLDNLKFGNKDPHAEPLHVDQHGRVILFSLKPDQLIREHHAPSSPFFVVVLKGHGIFSGGDGVERIAGPNILLAFDPGENHSIRAVEELVFVGILHGIIQEKDEIKHELT